MINDNRPVKSADELLRELQIKQQQLGQAQKSTSTFTEKKPKSADELLRELKIKHQQIGPTQKTTSTFTGKKPKSADELLRELQIKNQQLEPPKKTTSISSYYQNVQTEDEEFLDRINAKLDKINVKLTNVWRSKTFYKVLAGLGILSYFTGKLIFGVFCDGPKLKENPYDFTNPYEDTGIHQERDEKITQTAKYDEENNEKKDYNIEDIDNKIMEIAQLEETDNDYSYAYDAANETIGEKYGVNFYYDDEVYSDSNTTSKHR